MGAVDFATDEQRNFAAVELEAHRQAVVASLGDFALQGGSQDQLISRAVAARANLLPTDFVTVLTLSPGDRDLLVRAGAACNESIAGLVPFDRMVVSLVEGARVCFRATSLFDVGESGCRHGVTNVCRRQRTSWESASIGTIP